MTEKETDVVMTDEFNTNVSDKINQTLLDNHTYFLTGEINNDSVTECIKWILYENAQQNEGQVLTLYINSHGGSLTDAFALIDIMHISDYPIETVGIGMVWSSAFLIFASGYLGRRVIGKNTSIMCHQFSDVIDGKNHDIKATIKEMNLTEERMIQVIKKATNLDVKTIKSKLLPPTDVWLTAEELIDLGIADSILD